MTDTAFVNDARVMSQGQVLNSAVYALMRFQKQMKGAAEKAGFVTEEDVAEWITKSRREENTQ